LGSSTECTWTSAETYQRKEREDQGQKKSPIGNKKRGAIPFDEEHELNGGAATWSTAPNKKKG